MSLRERLERAILREAERHHIDPLLIMALMEQESGFKVAATSNKGAMGPMQLMPGTAKHWGVKNPRDPDEAVRGGTQYLVWLIDRFDGNVALGLAGYNAGEGAVDKYGRRIPPYRETQNYVRLIAARYERLREAHLAGVRIFQTVEVTLAPVGSEPAPRKATINPAPGEAGEKNTPTEPARLTLKLRATP